MVDRTKAYLNVANESNTTPLQLSPRPSLIVGGYGDAPQQMKRMTAAVSDDTGRAYVLDDWNMRVLRFSADGEHLGNWLYGTSVTNETPNDNKFIISHLPPQRIVAFAFRNGLLYATDGSLVWTRDLQTDACQTIELQEPSVHARAMSISDEGNIVLGYYMGEMAKAFRPDGELIRPFSPPEVGEKPDVTTLIHDTNGQIWVALKRHNTIHQLDPVTGSIVTTIKGDPPGRVAGMVIGSDDLIWVRSDRYPRVDRFTLQGDYVDSIDVTDPRGLPSGRGLIAWIDQTKTLLEIDAENACVKWWPTGVQIEVDEIVDLSVPTPEYPAGKLPDHVSLQWTDDPKTTMALTWRTLPEVESTVVAFRKTDSDESASHDGTSFDQTATGTSTVIATNLGPLRMHEVHLRGLSPDTTYEYRVGSGNDGEWSQVYSFRTAPAIERKIRIGIIGEIHEGGASHRAVSKAVTKEDPDFVLNTGDVVTRGAHQALWDEWSHFVGDLPARAPHIVAMGNHDTHRGVVSAYYRTRFGLTRINSCPGLEGTAYSFDYGPVHIVVLSTTEPIGPQTKWLNEDLKNNTKPWTIVNMHVPPFTSKANREQNEFRGTVVPLFTKYGVDLIVSGHDKSYMRTFPMRNEQPMPPGTKGVPVYLTIVSGESFYDIIDYPWIDFVNVNETMYGMVEIDGDQLTFTATTIDGKVMDQLVLTK